MWWGGGGVLTRRSVVVELLHELWPEDGLHAPELRITRILLALKPPVTPAVTAAVTPAVTAAVTPAVTAAVTPAVTAAVTDKVPAVFHQGWEMQRAGKTRLAGAVEGTFRRLGGWLQCQQAPNIPCPWVRAHAPPSAAGCSRWGHGRRQGAQRAQSQASTRGRAARRMPPALTSPSPCPSPSPSPSPCPYPCPCPWQPTYPPQPYLPQSDLDPFLWRSWLAPQGRRPLAVPLASAFGSGIAACPALSPPSLCLSAVPPGALSCEPPGSMLGERTPAWHPGTLAPWQPGSLDSLSAAVTACQQPGDDVSEAADQRIWVCPTGAITAGPGCS